MRDPAKVPPSQLPAYRKALYMGRYQQTKEQGVKRRIQRMESPKPEPLLVSTQKLARQAKKLRRSARVLPERRGWRVLLTGITVTLPKSEREQNAALSS